MKIKDKSFSVLLSEKIVGIPGWCMDLIKWKWKLFCRSTTLLKDFNSLKKKKNSWINSCLYLYHWKWSFFSRSTTGWGTLEGRGASNKRKQGTPKLGIKGRPKTERTLRNQATPGDQKEVRTLRSLVNVEILLEQEILNHPLSLQQTLQAG